LPYGYTIFPLAASAQQAERNFSTPRAEAANKFILWTWEPLPVRWPAGASEMAFSEVMLTNILIVFTNRQDVSTYLYSR
jgi:hypothetical protein